MTKGEKYIKIQRKASLKNIVGKDTRPDGYKNKTGEKGIRFPKSIIEFSNPNRGKNRSNLTQKPVALFEYLIKTYTKPGEVVLDNCIGSGTTAVACINTDRNYIGIEQEPKYVEIAKQRAAEALKLKQEAE
jgi:site-specific DNA-methyltransferase (adenine-specific)